MHTKTFFAVFALAATVAAAPIQADEKSGDVMKSIENLLGSPFGNGTIPMIKYILLIVAVLTRLVGNNAGSGNEAGTGNKDNGSGIGTGNGIDNGSGNTFGK